MREKNIFLNFFLQEHPAELHLPIIAFQIEYKEKHLKWDQAYHVTKQKGWKVYKHYKILKFSLR